MHRQFPGKGSSRNGLDRKRVSDFVAESLVLVFAALNRKHWGLQQRIWRKEEMLKKRYFQKHTCKRTAVRSLLCSWNMGSRPALKKLESTQNVTALKVGGEAIDYTEALAQSRSGHQQNIGSSCNG